jgi:hypothetical protein
MARRADVGFSLGYVKFSFKSCKKSYVELQFFFKFSCLTFLWDFYSGCGQPSQYDKNIAPYGSRVLLQHLKALNPPLPSLSMICLKLKGKFG